MFLANIAFAVFVCTSVTKYACVSSEGDDKTERPPENHTFVALIDILFADGTKRVCTGTIIHNNAVITAAHCFLNHDSEYTDIELSGSFIVIGTKKMFDTGYESYLPIERVITHPNYKGWTADLALVFTFSSMTTDKPGHVVPLVEDTDSTPVDSNVTVLSWGHYCEEELKKQTTANAASDIKIPCDSSEESCESRKHRPLRQNSKERADSDEGQKGPKIETDSKHRTFQSKVKSESTTMVVPSIKTSTSSNVRSNRNVQTPSRDKDRDRDRDLDETKESTQRETKEHTPGHLHKGDTKNEPSQSKETQEIPEAENPTLSIGSPYLIPNKGKEKKIVTNTESTTKKRRYEKAHRLSSNFKYQEEDTPKKEKVREAEDWSKILDTVIQKVGLHVSKENENRRSGKRHKHSPQKENATQSIKSIESRRSGKRHKHSPQKDNKLTVKTFGFLNVQTCKKIIDKTLPKLYKINSNEVVCYAAEDYFISDDDSGAPAIREGRLVAVTVGGAECEGDHVAVGMKMTCFCSWILENLPAGDTNLNCCTDCCGEEKHHKNDKKDRNEKSDVIDNTYLRYNHKNKLRKRSEEDDD